MQESDSGGIEREDWRGDENQRKLQDLIERLMLVTYYELWAIRKTVVNSPAPIAPPNFAKFS